MLPQSRAEHQSKIHNISDKHIIVAYIGPSACLHPVSLLENTREKEEKEEELVIKFNRSPNNLSWDIVLTDQCLEKKKKNKKNKNADLTKNHKPQQAHA